MLEICTIKNYVSRTVLFVQENKGYEIKVRTVPCEVGTHKISQQLQKYILLTYKKEFFAFVYLYIVVLGFLSLSARSLTQRSARGLPGLPGLPGWGCFLRSLQYKLFFRS